MWFGIPTDELSAQYAALYAGQSIPDPPIIGKRVRCKGCGKFMSKDLHDSYVIVGDEVFHIKEKCITKAVELLRARDSKWNWRFKEEDTNGTS